MDILDYYLRDEIDRQIQLDDIIDKINSLEDIDDQFSLMDSLDLDLNDSDIDYIERRTALDLTEWH